MLRGRIVNLLGDLGEWEATGEELPSQIQDLLHFGRVAPYGESQSEHTLLSSVYPEVRLS